LDFDIGNVELMAKASMPEIFQNITTWLATFGIKVLGILIAFIFLSQRLCSEDFYHFRKSELDRRWDQGRKGTAEKNQKPI
jgi:hypothetical protein